MRQLVSITDTARNVLLEKLLEHGYSNIRLEIRAKGCSGNSYSMDFVQDKDIKKYDEIVEIDSTHNLVVDAGAIMKVAGMELDWLEDGFSSRLVFNNPNITGTCGCGESFSV
jgi:iron-sulfur cluster assembly accessory protein